MYSLYGFPLLSQEDAERQLFTCFLLSKAIACLLFRYLFLSFQQNPEISYTLNVRQTLNGWVTASFQEEKLPFTNDVSFTLPHKIA